MLPICLISIQFVEFFPDRVPIFSPECFAGNIWNFSVFLKFLEFLEFVEFVEFHSAFRLLHAF